LNYLSVSALVLFIKFVILVTNKIIKIDKIKGHNFYNKEFPKLIKESNVLKVGFKPNISSRCRTSKTP